MARRLEANSDFQADFLILLGQLLQNGFALKPAFAFLPVIFPKQAVWLKQISDQLAAGEQLATCLRNSHFPPAIVAQVELTEFQGQLGTCLQKLGHLQKIRQKRHREIRQLLAYPLFLIVFLLGLIGLLRLYLLPEIQQLNPDQTGISPLKGLLIGLIAVVIFGGLLAIKSYLKFKKLSILAQLRYQFKLPIIGPLIQQYYHYCVVFDLGTCLANGLKLTEICHLAQHLNQQSWLTALMANLTTHLSAGDDLLTYLQHSLYYPLELSLILAKNNPPNQLAQEIQLLATLKYERLQNQFKRQLSWLQPLLFILIGIIIICTYLSILLPLYQTMEGIA